MTTSFSREDTERIEIGGQAVPGEELVEGRYAVRFARNAGEIDTIQKLRFEVFNLELGEGLESSFEDRRDRDVYDACCHHLMVLEQDSGQVVGTYRLQTSAMARAGEGFYSATLFDLGSMPPEVVGNAVEVGRACIALEHRNTQVLFLLWKGLARFMASTQRRYLFGCCSLTSQDPALGHQVLRFLARQGHLHPEITIPIHPPHVCPESDAAGERPPPVKLPKLFRIYLRYGAKVCSPPAIDRQFKTIDFLVLFDVTAMEDRQFRMFFG